ncbi:unnamed protein product, partial [Didymodactylos carnosus]
MTARSLNESQTQIMLRGTKRTTTATHAVFLDSQSLQYMMAPLDSCELVEKDNHIVYSYHGREFSGQLDTMGPKKLCITKLRQLTDGTSTYEYDTLEQEDDGDEDEKEEQSFLT